MDKVSEIPKKWIGFEVELGCHMRQDGIETGGFADAGAFLCEAHEDLFGIEGNAEAGCGAGLGEFGTHMFRVYLDHGHPEISSPMAASAKELVLWQHRARALAQCCRRRAEGEHGPLCVHFACSNRQGSGWGYHLNVMVSRRAFDRWRDASWEPLLWQWIPFLATAPILFGAGKVGSENGAPPAPYQLSQRADFFTDQIASPETVASKSFVNERDEALADPDRYARFHIAGPFEWVGCDYSSWLKCGTVQLLLALIESGDPLPDLRLADPLAALLQVSRDLTLSKKLELANGTHLTATEVQEQLARAAEEAVQSGSVTNDIVPDAGRITSEWLRTARQLKAGDRQLGRRLDWIAKKRGIERVRSQLGCSWDDPRVTAMDLRYGELHDGWFERLESGGMVDVLCDFLPSVDDTAPLPASPRDEARSAILSKFPGHVSAVNWNSVCLSVAHGRDASTYKIALDDPEDAAPVLSAANRARTVGDLVRRLGRRHCRKVKCVRDGLAPYELAAD